MADPLCGQGDPLNIDVTIDTEDSANTDTAESTVAGDLAADDLDTTDLAFSSDHGPDGPVHEPKPFDQWARIGCARVAMDRLNALLESALDDDTTSACMTFNDELSVAVSQTTTVFDRDGSVVSESTASLDDLLAVVPRSITATVSIDDRSHTETFCISIERSESHLL